MRPVTASSSLGTPATVTAEGVSSALLNAFNVTLDEVDSYLTGLEMRTRCEEDYMRALRSTLDRSKDIEAKLDCRIGAIASNLPGASNLPSMRRAWKELQQETLQEIDVRARFIDTLRSNVIAPLRHFHDGQERIRRRIREDLKESLADYDEMRHLHLKRIKKNYYKACELVESLKLQQQAAEEQRLLLSPPSRSSAAGDSVSGDGSNDLSSSSDDRGFVNPSLKRSGSFGREKKMSGHRQHHSVGSPPSPSRQQSQFALSPPGDPGSRKAPAAFLEAFKSKDGWEHARKEAAKRTNALLTKMRDSTTTHDTSAPNERGFPDTGSAADLSSLQHSTSMNQRHAQFAQSMAVKLSKAKREAADADKIYRKTVFDLETLALRRDKTLAAARSSVLGCRRELFFICSESWFSLARSLRTLGSTQNSLAHYTEEALMSLRARGNLDHELAVIDARMPFLNSNVGSEDGPVPYVNYWHGEYRSLLFGVSLVDYDFAKAQRGAPQMRSASVEPPIIVRKCIEFIEKHALEHPGIYRISAKHTAVQQLAANFEKDEIRFEFDPQRDEPAAVAGVLKQWLRELPQPVMAMPREERLKLTHSLDEQLANGFAALKGRIRRLPSIHQVTLKSIIEHLARVAAHSSSNKMTPKNLSVVFGPVLLSEGDPPAAASTPGGGLGTVANVLGGSGGSAVTTAEGMSLAAAMEEDNVCEILITFCSDIFSLERFAAPVVPWNPTSTGASLRIDLDRAQGTPLEHPSSVGEDEAKADQPTPKEFNFGESVKRPPSTHSASSFGFDSNSRASQDGPSSDAQSVDTADKPLVSDGADSLRKSDAVSGSCPSDVERRPLSSPCENALLSDGELELSELGQSMPEVEEVSNQLTSKIPPPGALPNLGVPSPRTHIDHEGRVV